MKNTLFVLVWIMVFFEAASLAFADGYAFKTISASEVTCGILINGKSVCWGYNEYGRLGNNVTGTYWYSYPAEVAGNHTFTDIKVGYNSACGILTDGSVLCWGRNKEYELGDGTSDDKPYPTPVIGGYKFKSISVGYQHSCGILTNGSAVCWGANLEGQLGDGTIISRNTPVFVVGNYNFTKIGTGEHHSCGILSNGTAMCWGANLDGRLGISNSYYLNNIDYITAPVTVLGDYKFTEISLGGLHTCAILTNGSALCWGYNGDGELGCGTNHNYYISPNAVYGSYNFTSISLGGWHSCGLLNDGTALCWGYNSDSEVGDDTAIDRLVPTYVLGGYSFAGIISGRSHTCGLLYNGSALCWGGNGDNRLGDGTYVRNRYTPVYVIGPSTTSTTTTTTSSTTTTTITSSSSTTQITTSTTTSTTTLNCVLNGDLPPCGTITLGEVISSINIWASDQMTLQDIITLITAWASPENGTTGTTTTSTSSTTSSTTTTTTTSSTSTIQATTTTTTSSTTTSSTTLDPTHINLAFHKQANSSINPETAEGAVDGDITTYDDNHRFAIRTPNYIGQWWEVDLGVTQEISKIAIYANPGNTNGPWLNFPTKWHIDYSTNGNNWTRLITETNSPLAYALSYTFTKINTRYFKITADETNNVDWWYMQEFEVYDE